MIGHSTSRACVFINSNNPSMPSQLINSPTPLIRPPFPPTIDPHDLISPATTSKDSKNSKDDLSHKKLRTRAPNAFIIYRKVFIETARSQGYYLPMTVISSMASQSWEKENEMVKSEYRRLAREAFNIHCEMLPKSFSPRRRKREKWNIISFDDQDNNNNNNFVRTKKEELPGLYSWNSRSTTEPCIEHVTFSNSAISSSNICTSGLPGSPGSPGSLSGLSSGSSTGSSTGSSPGSSPGSPGSPVISNNIILKECYNPALKLPPLIPPNSKNHLVHTSLPKIFKKPVISSNIRLLLNDDDE